MSVYLDEAEESTIRECARERGQDVSWLLREAGLFESEHQLSALTRSAKFGDQDAAVLLVRKALGLARLDVTELPPLFGLIEIARDVLTPSPHPTLRLDTSPPAFVQSTAGAPELPLPTAQTRHLHPTDIVVVATPRESSRLSVEPQVAVEEAAHLSSSTRSRWSERVASYADVTANALAFCWCCLKAVSELIGLLSREILELLLSGVRGWMRGGPRRDRWPREPERWSTAAVFRLFALFAVLLLLLPVNFGPGALGYFLLGGGEGALAQAALRSAPSVRRQVVAGWIAASEPGSVEAIEQCERRSRRQGQAVTCKVQVLATPNQN